MKKLLLLSFVVIQSGCAFMLSYIKDKKASPSETNEAKLANEFMWDQFHLGHYDSIPQILQKLNQAYRDNPNDATVAANLGFIYLWNFSERVRMKPDERVLENVFLSNRFFREAITLNPKDARYHGFQAAVQMCEGALTNNLELLAQSYFSSLKAIRKWPQFNKFALGYIESQLDTGSRMYRQGLRYHWEIIDECSKNKLTPAQIMNDPKAVLTDLYNEINNSDDEKIKRACGNSWIAPHNWEGFFLNFGDMLVKAGKLDEAKTMYEAIRIAPSFQDWPYKELVAKRIAEMELNMTIFNTQQKLTALEHDRQMMINSAVSCTGCHQMSHMEFVQNTIPSGQKDLTKVALKN